VKAEGGNTLLPALGSAGGTLVNAKSIKTHPLMPGDVIRVGDPQLRYHLGDSHEQSTVVGGSKPAMSAAQTGKALAELVGTTLAYFEIGPAIAKGRSGMVFQARDTKENQVVALKVLLPEFSKNEAEMQRFIRGMKTVMPLRHANLVEVFGAGKTGPYCWISMEYVEGESLTHVIHRIGTANMLDWKHALRVAIHIGRALDYAQ